MTVQQEIQAPISEASGQSLRFAESSQKNGNSPMQRKSFFGKAHLFQNARSSLKKTGNSPTAYTDSAPTMTTKTITQTKSQVVDGQQVTETTTTTVTEPAVPKGLRGKLIKKLSRRKKITHQVVTRTSAPLGEVSSAPVDAHVPSVADALPAKQGGVKRVATAALMAEERPTNSFIISTPDALVISEPVTTSNLALIPQVPAIKESTPQEAPSLYKTTRKEPAEVLPLPPSRQTPATAKQRGMRRVSTPIPVSFGDPKKAFFVLPQEESSSPSFITPAVTPEPETPSVIADESAVLIMIPEAKTHSDANVLQVAKAVAEKQANPMSKTTSSPTECGKSLFAPKSPTSVADTIRSSGTTPTRRNPPRTRMMAATTPAGVPSMFAHAYGSTPKRWKAPKQIRAPQAAQVPFSAPTPAQMALSTRANVDSPANVGLKTSNHSYHTSNNLDNQDLVSEYEEFTIPDDEIYEITYYEEETVVDDGSQQVLPSTSNAKPPPGKVKVEGMELLLANIRIKVPTVN